MGRDRSPEGSTAPSAPTRLRRVKPAQSLKSRLNGTTGPNEALEPVNPSDLEQMEEDFSGAESDFPDAEPDFPDAEPDFPDAEPMEAADSADAEQ